MESPENHPKGSLVVSFLFLLEPKGDPAQRSAFGKEEGGCEYGAFAAPAEAQCSWLLLTPRRFFSFSKRERKEWGRKNAGGQCPPLRHLFWRGGKSRANNPSVTAAPCHLPLQKGGIRCGGAEKGGPIGAAFQNRVIWLFSGRSPNAPAALRSSMWDFETFGQAIENSSMERNVLPSRPSMMSHAARLAESGDGHERRQELAVFDDKLRRVRFIEVDRRKVKAAQIVFIADFERGEQVFILGASNPRRP